MHRAKLYWHWNANNSQDVTSGTAQLRLSQGWWHAELTVAERDTLRKLVGLTHARAIREFYFQSGAAYQMQKETPAELATVPASLLTSEGNPKLLVTFTGPSCSGKTKLVQELTARYPTEIGYIRSLATRPARSSDESQIYRFISEVDFLDMDLNHEILQKVYFKGQWYGSHRAQIFQDNREKIAVAIVEPSGVQAYRNVAAHFNLPYLSIYLDATESSLRSRWTQRYLAHQLATGDANLDYYQNRQASIGAEMDWRSAEDYDIYLGPSLADNFEQLILDCYLQLAAQCNSHQVQEK